MEVQIKVTGTSQALNSWTLAKATANGETYKIQMVRFDNPSEYGIGGNGRISKLYVAAADGKILVNYDRGWDIRPRTAAAKAILNAIIEKFN